MIGNAGSRKAVAAWLFACSVMLAFMVLIGGLTRLTHSGLSIVEWNPIIGALPPFTEAAWQAVFEKYQQFPEYRLVNTGMSLGDFKGIFWLEYIHRLWGRLIGLVFLLPLLWFLWKRSISRNLGWRLFGIFILGGLQGLMGWYMVKSGLVNDPAVSPFRLTAHLGLAFLIHAAILWTALDVLTTGQPAPAFPSAIARPVWHAFLVVTALVCVTLLFGGLVAGHHAGLIYNTFPLMDGKLVPNDLLPAGWPSLFGDIKTVQFAHRCLAETTLVTTLGVCLFAARRLGPVTPRSVMLTGCMAILQVGLGVGTLVMVVPVWLASLHQVGAFMLLTLCLWTIHALQRSGNDGAD